MVYGREYGGRELEFEASGALLDASLVMRDRQTDSWWSIMTSDAIGGPLEGTALEELPAGRKTTFGEWRAEHPDTLVLSIDGREHVEHDPYAGYFSSPDTFRDLEIDDDRLPPKEPIYAFRLGGEPWAIPHRAAEGGRRVELPEGRGALLFHRPEGAAVFASTAAWRVPPELADADPDELLAERTAELEPLEGFDTYWYTWVSANEGSGLIE